MKNILLVIVFTILIFLSFQGYRKGAVKIAASLISVIISLVLVSVLAPTVSDMLCDTPLYDVVEENISTYVSDNIDTEKLNDLEQTGVSAQKKIIKGLPLPEVMQEKIIENNNEENYIALGVDNFGDFVSAYLTKLMMNIIGFALVFIVVYILIFILLQLTNIITKLPGVNFANRTLGTAIGLAEGIILVWILCIILTALSNLNESQSILNAIEENQVLSFIYDNNILMYLIISVLG